VADLTSSTRTVAAGRAGALRRRRRTRGGALAWRSGLGAWWFVLPICALLAAFVAYPLGRNLYVSFFDWDGLTQTTRWVGLDNYQWAVTDRASLISLRNVALFGALTVPVQMALGLVLAIALRGTGPLRLALRAVIFLPVVLMPVAVGFLFADILEPNDGLLNRVLRSLSLDGLAQPWLGQPTTALLAVAAVNVWMWTGLSMAFYQAGLASIPREIVEAAAIDGARPRQIAWRILVPMLRGSHFALLILGVIGTLKTFDLVYVLSRGGPDHATEMPTTYLFSTAFGAFQHGRAAALGVIVLAIALILTAMQLRWQRGRSLA
jgi:raffinose/stachyose/melibiose transport system permease protein